MVKNLPCDAGDAGSIPGWGTKIQINKYFKKDLGNKKSNINKLEKIFLLMVFGYIYPLKSKLKNHTYFGSKILFNSDTSKIYLQKSAKCTESSQ